MNAHTKRLGKLWSWHRWGVYLSLLLCAVSGLAWFVLRDLGEPPADGGGRWVIVTHGLAGFLALMAFGSVLPTHVRVTWRAHKNRIAGTLATALLALLSLSALGLYYGSEEMHDPVKWLHIGVGLAALAAFPVHVVLGRRARHHPPVTGGK